MNILVEKTLQIPMRDGVKLTADVYRPADGTPVPVLITRSPYNKDVTSIVCNSMLMDIFRMVQAGYAVVAQDVRGRFASEGTFTPFFQEPADGADTVAWAASQRWSSGKVGTFGMSYLGMTQWLTAGEHPEALQAMVPMQTPASYYHNMQYQGGAFLLSGLNWCATLGAAGEAQRLLMQGKLSFQEFQRRMMALGDLESLFQQTPLINVPALKELTPYYFDWLAHPDYDYWASVEPKYEQITAPALNVGGWYDFFQPGALDNYHGMRTRGGSELARQNQRLIMGPWTHGGYMGMYPERNYGMLANIQTLDMTGLHIRWYDHWLKGIDNGVEREKRVRLFVMGADVWREEDDWPLPDTRYQPFYLHSNGRANTLSGDGLLSAERPGSEEEDAYLYDPRNPVPTVGGAVLFGANLGARDQRNVESRLDVLCYTTPPLERPIEVTGPIELVLFISSSARDTDFTGKLVDVYPNGRAEILSEGILRVRYRESFSHPVLMEPGHIYELHIDLWSTSNLFKAGHCIRLEVSSSSFPHFDRNTNTGGEIANEGEKDFVQAINRVYHDSAHPSHLILPLIERD